MKKVLKTFLPFLLLLLCVQNILAQNTQTYTGNVMSGISNKGNNKDKPYLTPGDKTYIVGTQDGNFPDLGSHVEGEMGGLWMQPIKLMDGFWVKLSDNNSRSSSWLNEAKEFINYPYGNRFIYKPVLNGIETERFQFCPQATEGMVVQYQFKNTISRLRHLSVEFTVKTDLSPVWFSKENNIEDATDTIYWMDNKKLLIAKDKKNPWIAIWGSTVKPYSYNLNAIAPVETKGLGKAASTFYTLNIRPYETITITFLIAGSNKDVTTAQINYDALLKNYNHLLIQKKKYYEGIINQAMVDIPDKKWQQAYTWGKINTEWLVSEPSAIGRFLGAGAIEYPWLFGCDNSYALQGAVTFGNLQLAKSTLRLIKNVSEKVNGNGRIIHEMSANGFVYNKGNSQETPHFALAVWKVFEWTGDKEFLREMYPYIKKGINWLFTEQDKNKNLFPEGYGIMEVKGLNAELIDVAVYSQQALEATSRMATIFNENDLEQEYSKKAEELKNKINNKFWDEDEGIYCDFYGSREQALSVAKGALEQLNTGIITAKDSLLIQDKKTFYKKLIQQFSSLPSGTERGWFTNKNWVISTPVETKIAPQDKAIRLLDKVRNEDCGEYGPYLSAVERRYMMTISTGVQAMAECAYGRTDQALWYVNKIVETFNKALPGSISEMMPDYGCPTQAWTIYGLATPLVTYIFGINPDAYNKHIELSPHLPDSWKNASIYTLPVGDNAISLTIQKGKSTSTYSLTSLSKNWSYTLHISGLTGKNYKLNGKLFTAEADEINLNCVNIINNVPNNKVSCTYKVEVPYFEADKK